VRIGRRECLARFKSVHARGKQHIEIEYKIAEIDNPASFNSENTVERPVRLNQEKSTENS
jgi:hypothetical protein